MPPALGAGFRRFESYRRDQNENAGVVKLVTTADLKSAAFWLTGSSPVSGTKSKIKNLALVTSANWYS